MLRKIRSGKEEVVVFFCSVTNGHKLSNLKNSAYYVPVTSGQEPRHGSAGPLPRASQAAIQESARAAISCLARGPYQAEVVVGRQPHSLVAAGGLRVSCFLEAIRRENL